MFLFRKKGFKQSSIFLALLFTMPVWAAGPLTANPFSNSLTVLLISVMIFLLIVMAILARKLISAAGSSILKKKKTKEKKSILQQVAAIFIGLMLLNTEVFSQQQAIASKAVKASAKIGGLPVPDFYVMVSIILLELLVIAVLWVNTRSLLRSQQKATMM